MKTIVVTGGIGSGKSAVCALLRARGVPVYDCDRETKLLYERVPGLIERLEEVLGISLKAADGRLDRAVLSRCIFSDPSARETLESIVYPLVKQDFEAWRARQEGAAFVVLESAVILSKPLFAGVGDAVVLVTAPEDLRLRRVMARDGLSEEAVRARMSAQVPVKAALVLENAGTPEELEAAVERVFFRKNSYICKLLSKS